MAYNDILVNDLEKLLSEANKKLEENLAEHLEDQEYNFKCMMEISDDLDDEKARSEKLWSLLIISSAFNVLAAIIGIIVTLGVF